jgi:iron(III) transport system substrate-binding protein
MAQFRRVIAAMSAASVLTLAVAGCGGSPSAQTQDAVTDATRVFESFDTMADGERMAELIKAAEAEGAVTASLRADKVGPEIKKAFEAKYHIQLTILNPGRVDIVRQQIFEQAAAGKPESDVVETYSHELNTLYSDGGIVAKIPAFLAATEPDPTLASDYAVETVSYPFLPVWNKNAVSGENIPKSMEDFRNPFWKGKLVMVTNNENWYRTEFTQLTSQGMKVAEFEDLFKGIASNSSVADSSNPAAAGIASGQYLAGPGVAMVSAQKQGAEAPLTYGPADGVVAAVPAGLGLIKDAPHPAAALLFAHWYLTEGSDIVAKELYVAQSPAESDLKGVKVVRPDNSGLTAERLGEWRKAYENLLSGSGAVLPEYVRG